MRLQHLRLQAERVHHLPDERAAGEDLELGLDPRAQTEESAEPAQCAGGRAVGHPRERCAVPREVLQQQRRAALVARTEHDDQGGGGEEADDGTRQDGPLSMSQRGAQLAQIHAVVTLSHQNDRMMGTITDTTTAAVLAIASELISNQLLRPTTT